MLVLGRMMSLMVVALAAAADAPPPGTAPPATNVSPAAPLPASDDEIRAAFAGKAACPPEPWPVGTGPFEFRADGEYFRAQDLASAHGRYTIANGKICVTLTGTEQPGFCLAVLKDRERYVFRFDETPAAASRHDPMPVTPCELPGR
jgi:hypothetical protein